MSDTSSHLTRRDLFGRLVSLTAILVTPLCIAGIHELSTRDDSQRQFLQWSISLAAVALVATGPWTRPLRIRWGAALICLFAAWCFASALWSLVPWDGLHDWTLLATGVALYLIVTSSRLSTERLVPPLILAVVITAAFNALLAELQFLVTTGPLASTDLNVLLSQKSLGYATEDFGGKQTIRALFGHPNFLAGYLVPALALMCHMLWTRRGQRRHLLILLPAVTILCAIFIWRASPDKRVMSALTDWRLPAIVGLAAATALAMALASRWTLLRRTLIFLVALGILAAIVICRSRSGWLATGVITLVAAAVAWRHRRLRWHHAVLIIAAMAVAAVGLIQLRQRHQRTRSWEEVATLSTATSRMHSFAMAARMFSENPILGAGLGAYKTGYYRMVVESQREDPEAELYERHLTLAQGGLPLHVHNDYLEIAAETGLIGLALFTLILAWTAVGLGALILHRPASERTWLALAIGCGIIAILCDMMLSFPLNLPLTGSLFWILMGVAHRLIADAEAEAQISAR
ncbi:O-antigen ligase family protein [Candidatus Sumerlaeota bacterium]|nr:O-antigen ligase family protein [Candidatus Sumerlaeota bacterium]